LSANNKGFEQFFSKLNKLSMQVVDRHWYRQVVYCFAPWLVSFKCTMSAFMWSGVWKAKIKGNNNIYGLQQRFAAKKPALDFRFCRR
jgi:hypothetical protein